MHGFHGELSMTMLCLVIAKGVIRLEKDEKFNERTNHIEVHDFFFSLVDMKRKTLYYVEKVGTKHNISDLLIQAKLKHWLNMVVVCSCPS